MTGKKPATIEQTTSHAIGKFKSERVAVIPAAKDPIAVAATCAIQGASSAATITPAIIITGLIGAFRLQSDGSG
jgi:hypothetical protein